MHDEKIIRQQGGRERRAGTEIFKPSEYLPFGNANSKEEPKVRRSRDGLPNEEQLRLVKQFNDSLVKKNKNLNEQNIALKSENEELRCRVEILEEKCSIMDEEMRKGAHSHKKTAAELSEYKSINRCLEDIILQLNARIDSLINEHENQTQDTCDENRLLAEQQAENTSLKDTIVTLNRQISYFELEVTMLKREKTEAEKDRNARERLENQNKFLSRKLEDLQKTKPIGRVKSPARTPKATDLDYSVSFELDREHQ